MAKRKYQPPLHLDMPFDEAMERLAQTDPEEVEANIVKEKRRKSPAKETGDPAVRQLSSKRKPKNVRRLLVGK